MAGFLAGAVLHIWLFRSHNVEAGGFLFFLMPIAGAYLAPLAFAWIVPAACPRCGQVSAVAGARQLHIYQCRSCGASSNALLEMTAEMLEAQSDPVKQATTEGRALWIFLLLGVVAVGLGAWFAVDSVRLVREGVSVQGQVMRVRMTGEDRDSEGNTRLNYTAEIQYKAGATIRTLHKNWSLKPGSTCFAGCYDQGAMLKVIYLPSDPGTARVDSFGDLYMLPGIPMLVGLLFIAFGVLMLRRRRKL